MTWADVWHTIATTLLGTVVSVIGSLYLRHLLKLNRDELLRILAGVDSVTVINRKAPMLPLDQYRKAIAAGAGVALTGLLTWVESADLEPVLGPLVPEPFRPLVGVLLGGLATVAGVISAANAPKPGARRSTGTITVPALPTSPDDSLPSTSAGTAPVVAADATPAGLDEVTAATTAGQAPTTGPFWAGVPAGEPQAATALVELLPAPAVRSYQ